ncbi:NitT/TauT family transport system permease protein [Methylobacterium sp. PvP062]|uniref:NitT/TauT family transport system permease protein/taurine transport system permease protein n=1 Tax=Methylobacterium radiotolerans TaxID=31998 RepID=A0ABV2NTS9_9HYPH|nr:MULTISPECIES: ABC transporter permease [unclassified Methylobacterium]MBP2498297.1 NitT/TauT family transport system permease protein/taurine transport system permease protein [Methylobacterium sp. PvP105]MBP2505681.1 NitT/TauT family transport system permease protein/taurine transport system permease protein [Methylobacterium sp. PvP109]
MRPSPSIMRLGIVATILLLWQVVPVVFGIPEILLPSLTRTLSAGFESRGLFLEHFLITAWESALAVVISCSLGLVLGALVGASRTVSRTIVPLASMLYAIPLVVLYPLFTVWLGIGSASKLAFGSFYGFVPTFLASAAGVSTIPSNLRLVGRSLGATSLQELVGIVLPAAIPSIVSGVRLGGALAIVGVIAAEMLTSSEGLGYLISQFRTMLDAPAVFFSVLCVIALVVLFEILMRTLDAGCRRRWAPWKSLELAVSGEQPAAAAAG